MKAAGGFLGKVGGAVGGFLGGAAKGAWGLAKKGAGAVWGGMKKVGGFVGDVAEGLWGGIKKGAGAVGDFFGGVGKKAKGFAKKTAHAIGEGIEDAGEAIGDFVEDAGKAIGGAISGGAKKLGGFISGLFGKMEAGQADLNSKRYEYEAEAIEARVRGAAMLAKRTKERESIGAGARKAEAAVGDATPQAERRLARSAPRAEGQPLSDEMRRKLKDLLGYEPASSIRLHAGGAARQFTKDIRAVAATKGTDIFLSRKVKLDDPDDPETLAVLAHEITHVRQQMTGKIAKADKSKASSRRPTGRLVLPKLVRGARLARHWSDLFQPRGAKFNAAARPVGSAGQSAARSGQVIEPAAPGPNSQHRAIIARLGGMAAARNNRLQGILGGILLALGWQQKPPAERPERPATQQQLLDSPEAGGHAGGQAQLEADEKAREARDARLHALAMEAEARAAEADVLNQLHSETAARDAEWTEFMHSGDHHAHNPLVEAKGRAKPRRRDEKQTPLNYIQSFMKTYQCLGFVSEDDFLDELCERVGDLMEEEWQTERERGVQVVPF